MSVALNLFFAAFAAAPWLATPILAKPPVVALALDCPEIGLLATAAILIA